MSEAEKKVSPEETPETPDLNRRNFFNRLTKGALMTAGTVAGAEAAAMIAHTPETPAYPRVVTAGFPNEYQSGSLTYIEESQAWLGRDRLGFYAIDAHCTHLGCLVNRTDTESGIEFHCPCHGSQFAANGSVIEGPATNRLRYFQVDLQDDGRLSINRTQTVEPNERLIA